MKTTTRVGAIYATAFLGAGVISWLRGRTPREIAVDTLLHGTVAGTALNVVGYMVLPSGETVPVLANSNGLFSFAKKNAKDATLGKLSKAGVDLLSQIDGDALFSAIKANGVKIEEVPENASMITPDAD